HPRVDRHRFILTFVRRRARAVASLARARWRARMCSMRRGPLTRFLPAFLLAGQPLVLGACDPADSESDSTGETGEPAEACTMETRAMVYAAGMQVASNSGAVMATLAEATPSPPIRDLNDWQLRFTDADGASLGELEVSV